MSLPWKKPKSSRISRFMSELQLSPKRGGSLVVETGFPTSLIDLFVKNRDRLKKSSSKRLKRHIQTAPNAVSPIVPDVVLKNPPVSEPVRSKIEKVNLIGGELTAEADEKSDCVCGGSGAFLLMAFKIFIVAVLALSTKKKLIMGITLSAFALLLTELVAARVLTQRKEKPVVEKKMISCEKMDCCKEDIRNLKSISREETEPVVKPELSNLKIRDLLLKDEKSTSKSSKLKSKIVKKLRSYRKKKKTMKVKEEEGSSLVTVTEVKTERIEPKRDEEKLKVEESKGEETNGIVLLTILVIVLTGLLNGKILAIVMTLSCLFLRFGAGKRSSGFCM